MVDFSFSLPIEEALPSLLESLSSYKNVVLVAPPGAGKTTCVPLALLGEAWVQGRKIIMLEPRRLAAQGAAARMAEMLKETVGETIGLRVRLGSKVGKHTQIEVVTEGVFSRMILEDPELSGVAAVIFDEFHERSLDADFGLALALDVQSALRDDLRILVMSATLDGARVAKLLGTENCPAPIIESAGRSFPVETRYRGRNPMRRLEEDVADAVRAALATETGSILVFLPGQKEIRRTQVLLEEWLGTTSNWNELIDIAPLYGQLDRKAQDLAIHPTFSGRRKVVLSTSIAETSLTIEGVRVVIDAGLARVPCFEPDSGLTRLETVRASRAAVDQRRGRAGRTEAGVCIRLWEEAMMGAFLPFSQPEILSSDMAPLLLDCAAWGINDPACLRFLDSPPSSSVAEARKLLQSIRAIDTNGRLTETGRALQELSLPPRLARMVHESRRSGCALEAAEIASLLVERGLGGTSIDLSERLRHFRRDRSSRAQEMRRLAQRWAKQSKNVDCACLLSPGALLALAFPDRIARARQGGKDGAYILANGRGVILEQDSPLAQEPWLCVAEVVGSSASGRIVSAAALTAGEVEELFADEIAEVAETRFDDSAKSLRSRRVRRLGAIVLDQQPLPVEINDTTARTLADGIVHLGLSALSWSKSLLQWRTRVMFMRRAEGKELWPDFSDAALTSSIGEWLAPHLYGLSSLSQIDSQVLEMALQSLLSWDQQQRLEQEVPIHFVTPTGSRIPIDYTGDAPSIAVRVQELFGLKDHPTIAGGCFPLTLELLSPAHRPIQITRDLPGFWKGSWASVRAEMRGRYPKHSWPEDPANASATKYTKSRNV